MPDEQNVALTVRVTDAQGKFLGGTADIEFRHRTLGERSTKRGLDISREIAVIGLHRAPSGDYQVTVTPTDVFQPKSQFIDIPASGFATIEFIYDRERVTNAPVDNICHVERSDTMDAPMALGDITGSAPDVVSMALGISDAMSPEKGFAYNLCTFLIDLTEDKDDAKSGDAPKEDSKKKASLASEGSAKEPARSDEIGTRAGPIIFAASEGSHGETGGVQTVVEVGIREIASQNRIAGIVELRKLEGFDSRLFNNLAIEVTAQEQQIVFGSILLVIKGFVNPSAVGYGHFIGAVLITAQSGAGRPTLVARSQFITQAPPRGTGAGIFGQVVETSHGGGMLRVWTYRAPFGG